MAPADADTVHRFGWLVLSYLKTLLDDPTDQQIEDLIQDEKIRRMMRDELGMFNYQQSSVVRALEIVPYLRRYEDFRKRGPRRQLALLKNEGFRLAMQIAEVDYLF